MGVFHKELTAEKWAVLPMEKQILNIASELTRAKNWQNKNQEYFSNSLDRAIELIDFSISDRKQWHDNKLKELLRLREWLGQFYFSNSNKEFRNLLRCLLQFHAVSSTLTFS